MCEDDLNAFTLDTIVSDILPTLLGTQQSYPIAMSHGA
jgi:hypothetical protein